MNAISTHISPRTLGLFYLYATLSTALILLGFHYEQKIFLALPFVIPIVYLGVTDFKKFYYTLLFFIPLSTEIDVTESLGTDLPTEPLMVGLMLLVLFYLIKNIQKIDFSFFRNSIMLFLFIHIVWIFATTISSTVPLFSVKYLLAKSWYVFAFSIATAIVIRSKEDLKTAVWCIFIPLTFTVVQSLIRHYFYGFSFDSINSTVTPFYRNHVSYAAIIVVFLPFIFFLRKAYGKGSFKRKLLTWSIPLYVVALYFSYTRACYLALFAMIGAYFIIKWRLVKMVIPISIMLVMGATYYVIQENYYLKYAPTTSTVAHKEFGDLVDATFKAEDVSSMERVYRWVAGAHMINDRPITGFGPNGFVENYKNYTVFIFETWISANEEQSGIHNYFLMLAVEQGIPGMIIFILLLVAFFVFGEKVYHNTPINKHWAMAAMLSMIAIVVNLVFSDMIEVDKTGSFFFINLALLVLVSRNWKGLMLK